MVDEPCVGDHQQDHHPPRVKPSFGVEEHEQDHGLSLRGSGKRDRDSEFVDPIMQHSDEVEDDDEFDTSKKVKLEGIGLDDDSLLDDLKQTQLVIGGVGADGMVSMQGLGVGIQYFASTGNIKSPIFEGIPSLTPEWLLKKVWLKVNGDSEQTVLASLISKDMGPKLRQEIRTFLEKRGEIQTGFRINLKNTIMQAVEVTITCQKEKPTLAIVRDSSKLRPRKEGKQEKNFNIGLTPYGQNVCIAELQLKRRDSFAQRSPPKMGHLNFGMSSLATAMGMGTMGTMNLGDSTGLSPLLAQQITLNNNNNNNNNNIAIPMTTTTTATTSSPTISHPHSSPIMLPAHVQHVAFSMNMGMWKPNVKEINDEWLKRNVQAGDLSGQLMSMRDEVMIMKEECHKKDIMIAELKNIIMELKPSFPLPTHLLSPSDGVGVATMGVMDPQNHNIHHHHHPHLVHPHHHSHAHPQHHPQPHLHGHPQPHVHPHMHMHQSGDHTAMLHMNLMGDPMMPHQVSGDPSQSYMPH